MAPSERELDFAKQKTEGVQKDFIDIEDVANAHSLSHLAVTAPSRKEPERLIECNKKHLSVI